MGDDRTVAGTADSASRNPVIRLGLTAGQVVQEFGYDSDVDQDLREAVEAVTGSELLDEDADEVVDAVILWWRDGDGDLVDTLVDTLGALAEGGTIWLFTPKVGRDGHVDASDVEEAAPSVGLHATTTMSVGDDWAATRLLQPKGNRKG